MRGAVASRDNKQRSGQGDAAQLDGWAGAISTLCFTQTSKCSMKHGQRLGKWEK
jgi:hypothetical protein